MRPGSRMTNPIFKNTARLGLRACFYLLLSLIFITLDHQNRLFHTFREKLALVDMPFYYSVNLPIQGVATIVSNVKTHSDLVKSNARLKAENTLLAARLQKLLSLESDNSALLSLLEASSKTGGKVLEAEIIAVASDPFQHEVILNKGSHEDVFRGQPVLDAYGVMGQVVQIEPLVSRVMLITDSESAIPIQDTRSRIRAIASGDPENALLTLKNVPQTSDIKVGDVLVTSGLGERYPFGYPVAKVISVENDPNDRFAQIKAKPLAHLNRTRLVLLVWPATEKIHHEVTALLNEKGQSDD